jgi:indolepyruvate ferredoxin oxidoreductase beta subunit
MKKDIVLAGVGGQGVLSVAALIAAAAREDGLHVKQGEVHGMAQRGGAVQANLRLSDEPIHSDLIGRGTADMVLSMEPLESLRYVSYLAPAGIIVTSMDPVDNLDAYPDIEEILEQVRKFPHAVVVDTAALAREAGLARASNVVMVGAASVFLPIRPASVEKWLREGFAAKGERIVDANLKAFALGRGAVPCEKD